MFIHLLLSSVTRHIIIVTQSDWMPPFSRKSHGLDEFWRSCCALPVWSQSYYFLFLFFLLFFYWQGDSFSCQKVLIKRIKLKAFLLLVAPVVLRKISGSHLRLRTHLLVILKYFFLLDLDNDTTCSLWILFTWLGDAKILFFSSFSLKASCDSPTTLFPTNVQGYLFF